MTVNINQTNVNINYNFTITQNDYLFTGICTKTGNYLHIEGEISFYILGEEIISAELSTYFGTFYYEYNENGISFNLNTKNTEDYVEVFNTLFAVIETIKVDIQNGNVQTGGEDEGEGGESE